MQITTLFKQHRAKSSIIQQRLFSVFTDVTCFYLSSPSDFSFIEFLTLLDKRGSCETFHMLFHNNRTAHVKSCAAVVLL